MIRKLSALAFAFALLASAAAARPKPPATPPAAPSAAQAVGTHNVALSWVAGGDGTAATIYHIYRATAACTTGVAVSTIPSLSFVRLDGVSSAISSTNYTDATVGVGAFCYYVTAQLNGVESPASLVAGAVVRPLSPTGLAAN